MKPIHLAILTAVVVAGLHAQAPQPASSPASLLVRDVTLIDGTGSGPRAHINLFVRDGRIAAVASADAAAPAPDARLILDGRGLVVIPGLIDAHVHLSGDPRPQQLEQLHRALNGGVTAVWDLAGDCRNTADLARAALTGEIDSPAIYYAALMAGPDFFTDPRVTAASAGFRPGEAPWARAVDAGTDVVRAVAAARGTGATTVKLYAALDSEAVHRVTAEAKRDGLRVVAHGTVFPAKPSDLVDAGVDMLAHAAYLAWEGSPPTADYRKRALGDFAGVPVESAAIERLLEAMREKRVALNPTLWVFADRPSKDETADARIRWGAAVTHRAQQLGITIVAGTDGMIEGAEPLPTLHRELELLVNGAGLTPMQALVAATSGAARTMGLEGVRGTLVPGAVADLVLLDGNPADDIRNTRRIRYVIQAGRIVRDVPRQP